MNVTQIVNPYRKSNTYILDVNPYDVVLIDRGNYNIEKLLSQLKTKNKNIIAVILTHEHSDHCIGINELYLRNPFKLYCSRFCAENIKKSKQNFSYYIEEIPTFEIHLETHVLSDLEVFRIGNEDFQFIETPGHSPGSACIINRNMVFTGDTILNNTKTPLTFPHSSKKDYILSIEKLGKYIKIGDVIYPGHDIPFELLKEIKINDQK